MFRKFPGRDQFHRIGWRSFSPRLLHEAPDELRNLIRSGVEREMSAVDDMDFGLRHVAAVGLWLRGVERGLILAPDHEQARLSVAHPRLPFGVVVDVCAVIVEEVALNFGLAWLIEKIEFVGPEIRVVSFYVWVVAHVTRTRRRKRQEVCAQGALVGGA